MEITYREEKVVDQQKLVELFKSVEWKSGNYPEQLYLAIANSHSVITAWHGDQLVGLVNALSDGVMMVYYPYLLVHPQYQGMKIGKNLLLAMAERYKYCKTQALIAYGDKTQFYQNCGFSIGEGEVPLFISEVV